MAICFEILWLQQCKLFTMNKFFYPAPSVGAG